jgi:glycosyltransferase involved in cell wall biosynthesis
MISTSIIIPVFNDYKAIQHTISALKEQTADRSSFEIIVVDNGSTDGSVEWLAKQTDLTFLQETENLGSPYSCRNRGLEIAKGEYIALLDSTCIPDHNWVKSGIDFFENSNFLLFGGKVKFNFEGKPTLGKMYDSISNVQMEYSIKEKNEAKTANLWIKKSLILDVGTFTEGVRSGEDVRWTKYCTALKKIKIGYNAECSVFKYARGTAELLIKQVRVGKGQVRLWRSNNVLNKMLVQSFKKMLFPVRLNTLKAQIARNDELQCNTRLLVKLYLMSYMVAISTFHGNMMALIFKK